MTMFQLGAWRSIAGEPTNHSVRLNSRSYETTTQLVVSTYRILDCYPFQFLQSTKISIFIHGEVTSLIPYIFRPQAHWQVLYLNDSGSEKSSEWHNSVLHCARRIGLEQPIWDYNLNSKQY